MKTSPKKPSVMIVKARREMGISQTELALLVGVHKQTVAKWERGLLEPTMHQQTMILTMSMGHRRNKRDLKVWMAKSGWIATLSYLLASAYGFGPEDRWVKV